MMLALRSSIHNSLTSALTSHKATIDDLGERVDHVETKMSEFSKIADIEDRNRRNNIKITGIPESVSNSEVTVYFQQVMITLLHPASKHDLIIDRAHRLPKPKNVAAAAPQDVIMRVHFYHIKEAQLPELYHHLKLFADLSQYTIQARRALQPVTLALRQQNVPHRWGFPTKILIMRNGVIHIITSIADSVPVFKSLDIPFSPSPPPVRRQQTTKLAGDWSTSHPPPP